MSSLTPTPVPIGRTDEVTQPSVAAGSVYASEGRRGLERSPAQWEAEALATAEEAESREGVAAGALRYAAARMLEDGVGDTVAAADHLQMAVGSPPASTFRPVLGALRVWLRPSTRAAPGRRRSCPRRRRGGGIVVGGGARRSARREGVPLRGRAARVRAGPAGARGGARARAGAPRGARGAARDRGPQPGDAALLRTVLERKLAPARRSRAERASPARPGAHLAQLGRGRSQPAHRRAGAVRPRAR